MSQLIPVFVVNCGYESATYSRFDIAHVGVPFMSVEMHRPEARVPHGYFSSYWVTQLDNQSGKKALTESYGRLRKNSKFPDGSERLLAKYREMFGEEVELHLIVGSNAASDMVRQPAVCSLDGGILDLGVFMNGSAEGIVEEVMESQHIPPDFSFLRFDNPYCAHYFGNHAFVDGINEAGILSHVNLSGEIVELYRTTGSHKIPTEHLSILVDKLNEMFWRLPKLERLEK